MEQTRRDLSKVVEGIEEESQEALKFVNERRSEVLNSLNEKGLLKSDKIQKLAEDAVRLNSTQDIQVAYEAVIKKNEELLKNTSESAEKAKYEQIVRNLKADLHSFNQEINKISQAKTENNASKNNISEEQFVEEMKKIIEKIYQKEKNSIFNFVVEPNEHYRELEEYLKSVTSIPEEEKNLIKSRLLSENSKRLMNYFGEEPYKFYTFYCNTLNQKIEKLSQEEIGTKGFSEAYDSLVEVIDNMVKTASKNILVYFDKDTLTLNIKFPNNIIKNVNKQLVPQKANDLANQSTLTEKEKELKSFQEQAEAIIEVYFEEYEKTINTLKDTLNPRLLYQQLWLLVADEVQFSHLTQKEKLEITDKIRDSYEQEKNAKYGKGFIKYLQEVIISNLSEIPFDQLQNCEYGTKEFEIINDKVYDGIEKLKKAIADSELTSKFFKSMDFDIATQIFSIEFTNPNVPTYKIQIVSDKALAAITNIYKAREETLNNATTTMIPGVDLSQVSDTESDLLTKGIDPGDFTEFYDDDETTKGNPHSQTSTSAESLEVAQPKNTPIEIDEPNDNVEPTIIEPKPPKEPEIIKPVSTQNSVSFNPTKEAAVRDYLLKVEELNNTINLLNQLNQKLAANLIFLDIKNATNAINLESEAKKLDQKIIDIKLDLSQDRLKFKQYFNEYIISVPEVKAAKINSINFNDNNLNNFVALIDEQLANAENKIVELDKERQQCIDVTRISEIDNQISTILAFIESQNSLIARRIVSESENKDFDIVAFLQNRREKKKEIRERVKKAYENISQKEPEILEDNFEIKAGEGMPLPQSKSEIPSVEPISEPKEKVVREEPQYEIPPVTPTITPIITEPSIEKIFGTPSESVISDISETVPITPKPIEVPAKPEEQTSDQSELADDDPRKSYAEDDPMRYNKIPEVPAKDFDKMFETPAGKDDEMVPLSDEYLNPITESFEDDDAPVIPESSFEVPVNLKSSEISEPPISEQKSDELAISQTEHTPSENIELQETYSGEIDDDDIPAAKMYDDPKDALSDITSLIKEINGPTTDEAEAEPEDNEEIDDEIGDMINHMIDSSEILGEIIEPNDNIEPSQETDKSTMTILEDPDYTVQKLGYTIIDWTNRKGAIPIQEFKELYLSASYISEDAYNTALDKLVELNVIDIKHNSIQTKMSKEEFEKMISEYNKANENEKIPKEVTIELRILSFKPVLKTQKISRESGLILEGNTITITRINNGIKAKYSEDLRKKLSDLNAKLRLIKKGSSHSKITADIEADSPEQLLGYKDGRDINHEDYIVDIRIPDNTEPVFEYDLAGDPEETKGPSL